MRQLARRRSRVNRYVTGFSVFLLIDWFITTFNARGDEFMSDLDNGRFVWYELLAKDPKSAIGFYTDVVGWKTQPFGEGGDYVMWVGSQGPLGGVMKLPDEAAKMGTPPHWMAHVQVDNVDTTASLVKKLGGKVYREPTDIPS